MKRKAEKWALKACKHYKRGAYRRSKLYIYLLRIIFACDFSGKVVLHESVELVHNGLGCVFHPDTKIGQGCRIYQNVTLGGNTKEVDGVLSNVGAPVLGANVIVYSGACVLGPVSIGDNTIIGANSVVTKDVPANSLVIGNPAIIKENKRSA